MPKTGAATRFCNDTVGPTAFERITIVGGGAWGTALALTARRAGRKVSLWVREGPVVDTINQTRRNPFLPSVELPREIHVTNNLEQALKGAQVAALVTPSQHLRSVARQVEKHLPDGVPVVICTKGIEADSGMMMSEVVSDEMADRLLAVLSGPTFAVELAAGQPTAATIAAAPGSQLASRIAVSFATETFRPYLSNDVVGVEIGGATKNVLAIACGIAAGRGLGANTRAAIISRGLAEIVRLGKALGARSETFFGLAGAGDLFLTCSNMKSRNFSYGKTLGAGTRPDVSESGPVVEGVANARSVTQLASSLGVEMPICSAVDRVLRGSSIDEVIESLLGSDLRTETPAHENNPRIRNPARRRAEEGVST